MSQSNHFYNGLALAGKRLVIGVWAVKAEVEGQDPFKFVKGLEGSLGVPSRGSQVLGRG